MDVVLLRFLCNMTSCVVVVQFFFLNLINYKRRKEKRTGDMKEQLFLAAKT